MPRMAGAFSSDVHDSMLRTALFGPEFISLSTDEKTKLELLQAASYLCLDYTGKSNEKKGTDCLEKLNKAHVRGLPKKAEEIASKGGPKHRRYTHMGWDYAYSEAEVNANWTRRKRILLETVNKVFEFGPIHGKILFLDFGYNDICNCLARYVYCIHLLGDHIDSLGSFADGENKGIDVEATMPLADSNHDIDKSPDLFSEFQDCLDKLSGQSKEESCESFAAELKGIAKNARYFAAKSDWSTNRVSARAYCNHANELLAFVNEKFPSVLEQCDFFINTFNSVSSS